MKRQAKFIFILLIAGLLLRLVMMFFTDSICSPQTWEYEKIANNFLDGRGFYFTLLGTPYHSTSMILYPLICIIVYFFTHHSFLILKLVQIVISLFSCVLIYRISKYLFNEKVAIASMVLMLFHPGLLIYSVKLHPLTLDAFLFILFLYLFIQIINGRNNALFSILSGLSMGAALLNRATVGLFILPAFIMMFIAARPDKRKFLRIAFSFSVGLSLALAPLLARNAVMFNNMAALPNDSGFQFWIGNNVNSTGTANTMDGESIFLTASKKMQQDILRLNEFEQKKYFYNESVKFIKNNPTKSLVLFLKKLYYFWWFTPTQGQNYPKAWLFVYRMYYYFISFFAVAGFLASFKIASQNKKHMLIYAISLFCLTISVAQAIYYVDGRHRWAIEPFILIFTAYGIIRARECLKIKI